MNPVRSATKHAQLTRTLEELLRTLQPGDRFPSQTELMRQYGVSDRTVLRSLDDLTREGRLIRRRGAGTFVAAPSSGIHPTTAVEGLVAALVVSGDPTPFYRHCLDRLSLLAESLGFSLITPHVSGDGSEPLPLEEIPPLGFLALNYSLEPVVRALLARGQRAVVVGAPPAGVSLEASCVSGDHEHGGWLATNHLFALGHRRIAFLRSSGEALLPRTERWRGHLRALHEANSRGSSVNSQRISADQFELWRNHPAEAAEFFSTPEAPTAVAAWNDREADLLIRVLTAAGIPVPEQVSVIGYDALPEFQDGPTPLTTVDQHVDIQLRRALQFLESDPNGVRRSMTLIVPTLVAGCTTAQPPR